MRTRVLYLVILFLPLLALVILAGCPAPNLDGLFGPPGQELDAAPDAPGDAGQELDAGDAGQELDAGDAGQELDAGDAGQELDAGELGADDAQADAGDAGPGVLALVCGTAPDAGADCPPGYTADAILSSPTDCGGSGCELPGQRFVCVSPAAGTVRFNCDLSVCLGGGFSLLASFASCDCTSGELYICVP